MTIGHPPLPSSDNDILRYIQRLSSQPTLRDNLLSYIKQRPADTMMRLAIAHPNIMQLCLDPDLVSHWEALVPYYCNNKYGYTPNPNQTSFNYLINPRIPAFHVLCGKFCYDQAQQMSLSLAQSDSTQHNESAPSEERIIELINTSAGFHHYQALRALYEIHLTHVTKQMQNKNSQKEQFSTLDHLLNEHLHSVLSHADTLGTPAYVLAAEVSFARAIIQAKFLGNLEDFTHQATLSLAYLRTGILLTEMSAIAINNTYDTLSFGAKLMSISGSSDLNAALLDLINAIKKLNLSLPGPAANIDSIESNASQLANDIVSRVKMSDDYSNRITRG